MKNRIAIDFGLIIASSLVVAMWSKLTSSLLRNHAPLNIKVPVNPEFNTQTLITIFVLIPLIMTCIFQFIPLYLFLKKIEFKYSNVVGIIVSSSLFGLFYNSSLLEMGLSFIKGLILASLLLFFYNKDGFIKAFLKVSLVHSLSNMFLFL